MGETIYAYKGKYWKPIYNFQYTGKTEEFTLEPGSYLLMCHGAQGGQTGTQPINYGGVAYGVLTLQHRTTMYANVGGNGGAAIDNSTPGLGGFNGGGNGGHSYHNNFITGAGGGGATDIRLFDDDGSMYPPNENNDDQISTLNKSLLSRIIVAGGGGGTLNAVGPANYFGNGGGVVGGIIATYANSINYNLYPDQSSGYSFGKGMDAIDKTAEVTWCAEGASGGGGGWFGGYANGSPDQTYSSSNGGGGSGYVFTSDSYRLPEGYDNDKYIVDDEYCLTDTFIDGGLAIQPCAIVCVPVKMFNVGDSIIFPCINETEHVILPQGKYRLKCYGGDGGCRENVNDSQRGGYAEGVLNNQHSVDIYVNVGGSGIGTGILDATYAQMNRQSAMFNGGGAPGVMGNINSCAGGGATDIRIGSDSLYARIIVAGGAGGSGLYLGGVGGGEVGGTCQNAGAGTSPGPGTQTESPQHTSYPTINGGFGYGGNGAYHADGYGGAGGGGWFGGSGTFPNGNRDDDRGGNGGSGYVFTETVDKPAEYLLPDEYHLTDTVMVSGGNTLPLGHTEAIIEVLDCVFVSILCHDEEGYKAFNVEKGKWEYVSSTITPELFDECGYHTIPTDDGLLDEYDILIRDDGDQINKVMFNVVPPEQKISTTVKHRMNVSMIVPDAEYDYGTFDLNVNVSRNGVGSNATITLDTYVKKKQSSEKDFRLFCVQLYDK